MRRLADIAIDADGEELVFRVKPGAVLKSWLGRILAVAPEPVAEPAPTKPPAALPTIKPAPTFASRGATKAASETDKLDAKLAAYYANGASIQQTMKTFAVGQQRVVGALARMKVPIRPRGKLSRDDLRKRDAAKPKAKPIVIPKSAPRVKYEPPPPAPKGKRGEAYKKALAVHFARPSLGLTPEEQQALVKEHFAKGGAVTVVPSAPAHGALRFAPAVGGGLADGRRK